MLILTRRPTQTLKIDGRITVTVLEIRGGQVRIGVDAPADIAILRGELCGPGAAPHPASGKQA